MTLLPRETFESPETYSATAFHELAHNTGHASRLAREEVTHPQRFASQAYSREELVAEMGSAFLLARAAGASTSVDATGREHGQ